MPSILDIRLSTESTLHIKDIKEGTFFSSDTHESRLKDVPLKINPKFLTEKSWKLLRELSSLWVGGAVLCTLHGAEYDWESTDCSEFPGWRLVFHFEPQRNI